MSGPHLLIDARNLLYRAYYANRNKPDSVHSHTVTVALRFMQSWLQRFDPSAVSVFWDSPNTWRYKILDSYKKDRDTESHIEAKGVVISLEQIMREVLAVCGIRQFSKDGMEADDLIYAACKVLNGSDVVIISSDSDYTQIVYSMPKVQLYDPMNNVFKKPDVDPVVFKSLVGDSTDSIVGYHGIGKVRGTKLANSLPDRVEYLDRNGWMPYIKNMLLIDLSLCPEVLKNIVYVQKGVAIKPVFSQQTIYDLSRKYKIKGLVENYSSIIIPFKQVFDRNNNDSSRSNDSNEASNLAGSSNR